MSPPTVTSRPNLILGCGYLGRRVASRWVAHAASSESSGSGGRGTHVVALTRHNSAAHAALGVEPLIGDILDPPSLQQLPAAATVLYAVGLDRGAGKSMREVYVGGLGHVLDTLRPCDRFIYVSSTSVYSQTDGSLVDETSPTEPTEESGRIILEAEQLLRAKRPDAIILRFAGIYGPDRLLRRQAQLRSGEPLSGDPTRWLNLIHVDDGADAVLTAESRGAPGETYNIADDEPAPRSAFFAKLAELVGAPPPTFDHTPEPRANNRRISNAKAKAALGWRPKFPGYREGLPAAVESGERPA